MCSFLSLWFCRNSCTTCYKNNKPTNAKCQNTRQTHTRIIYPPQKNIDQLKWHLHEMWLHFPMMCGKMCSAYQAYSFGIEICQYIYRLNESTNDGELNIPRFIFINFWKVLAMCVLCTEHQEKNPRKVCSCLTLCWIYPECVGVWFGLFIYCIADNEICFNSFRRMYLCESKYHSFFFPEHNISNFLRTSFSII